MSKRPKNPYRSIIGRRGGRSCFQKYGSEFYRENARLSVAVRAAKPKPERKAPEFHTVCHNLRIDQDRRLGQVAKATKTPKAELIRQAVDMWLDEWTKRHANKISKKRVRPLAVDPKEGEE